MHAAGRADLLIDEATRQMVRLARDRQGESRICSAGRSRERYELVGAGRPVTAAAHHPKATTRIFSSWCGNNPARIHVVACCRHLIATSSP